MIVGAEVTSGQYAVWVGVLDLDDDDSVAGVSGPLLPVHQQARVLVRMHHAPIGYIQIPALPAHSLASRARVAAEASLSDALHRHTQWDQSVSGPGRAGEWAESVACPLRFPDSGGEGVTIVVCSRDRSEDLRACLSAMRQIRYEPLEILVVDNAPADESTQRVVRSLAGTDPRIRYTCEPRPGLSVARNHGLAGARYDIVAFTDDDTLSDPGWPRALVAGFAADPEVICVTGLVASSSLATSSERYFDARYASESPFEPHRYDMNDRVTRLYPYAAGIFGMGANFAVRRTAIAKLGGFDPALGAGSPGRGGEDLDMFLRVILAGWRICYVPAALIWHRHRTDASALSEQLYSYGHGLGAYMAKYLRSRDLQTALLSSGVRHAFAFMTQMRHASRAGQLGRRGSKLAFDEVRGVVTGAVRYWASRSRRRRSWPDAP